MSRVQVSKRNTFNGHYDSVYSLQPTDQPHLFFSAAGDGMIVSWNLQTLGDGELIAQLSHSIYSMLYLREHNLLLAGENFSGIHLIDYHQRKQMASLQLTSSAIFDIQGMENDLIVATGDGMITVVDIEKWSVKKKINASPKSARAIAINPFTREVAVGYSDYCIRIFNSDYELKQEIKAHQNSVFALCYSPDGKYLLSGARDARLNIWEVGTTYQLAEEIVAHLYAINHIAYSPDKKYFATCSMDKSIKIWQHDFKLIKVIDKSRHAGHGTSVNKLLWTSPHQLLSASDDRTISVWDLLLL